MSKDIWLIGCEESQAVTIELRKLGQLAYSCDTKPCSGGHPEWHLQIDVFEATGRKKNRYYTDCLQGNRLKTGEEKSKTFPNVAKAMAEQWTQYVNNL